MQKICFCVALFLLFEKGNAPLSSSSFSNLFEFKVIIALLSIPINMRIMLRINGSRDEANSASIDFMVSLRCVKVERVRSSFSSFFLQSFSSFSSRLASLELSGDEVVMILFRRSVFTIFMITDFSSQASSRSRDEEKVAIYVYVYV